MKILIQKSTRPMVENLSTCYVLELPEREVYTVLQQNICMGLSGICFNDISKGNGRTFVLPFGIPYEEEMWNEIVREFGEFVFVEKIC